MPPVLRWRLHQSSCPRITKYKMTTFLFHPLLLVKKRRLSCSKSVVAASQVQTYAVLEELTSSEVRPVHLQLCLLSHDLGSVLGNTSGVALICLHYTQEPCLNYNDFRINSKTLNLLTETQRYIFLLLGQHTSPVLKQNIGLKEVLHLLLHVPLLKEVNNACIHVPLANKHKNRSIPR